MVEPHVSVRDDSRGARTPHRTVDRIAAILECTARARTGLTLSEIARSVDAPTSSVQGLVYGLVAAGYLDEHGRRYFLGNAPYLLNRFAGRHAASGITHSDLEIIQAETGLTTVLSIAIGSHLFYADYSSSDPRFAFLAENYVRRSLLKTSAGWVLLAGMERRDMWHCLQTSEGSADPALIDGFFAALPQIADTGICISPRASEQGDGVSIAVREDGRTVAAVGVISTREEISARGAELAHMLRRAAQTWATR